MLSNYRSAVISGMPALDSHCKYYLMHSGYDRANTIGFRCIR
jgi:hypothetical protein